MGLADVYLGRAKRTVGSQVSSEGPALLDLRASVLTL